MNKLNRALLCLGLTFLVFLIWRAGPEKLWHEVGALGVGVIPLVLIEGLANLAHTIGWRHVIYSSHRQVPLLRLFRMSMAGYSINYLTPTASVGGEVSRAALLAGIEKGPEAVSSVLVDKLATGVAHVILAMLGALLLFWRVDLAVELWIAMAVTTLVVIGGLVSFFLMQRHGKLGGFIRWLVDREVGGRTLRAAASRISEVDDALQRLYRDRPQALVMSIWWHLLGHSAAILQAWVFLYLLNQPAPLATVASVGLFSLWFDLLTFAVPLNLGTLEGSRMIVFKALGCSALLGMTFGIAIRIAQVFWACFGLVSYGFFAAELPSSNLPSGFPTFVRNVKRRVGIP
jgi:uncharacterized protein (TIRG00374 family)